MLIKVVSGGQSGADQSGLIAAKRQGFLTGGWLPKGCITTDGPRPDLLETYSMREHTSSSYVPRTGANVRDSDGTIRLATNFKSPGELLTLKNIKWYNKPYIDVDMKKPRPWQEVVDWLRNNNIKVLNVAGNAETTSPGIGLLVEAYLEQVFLECRKGSGPDHPPAA